MSRKSVGLSLSLNQYKEQRNKEAAIVFFTASFCGPCKTLYPAFFQMEQDAPRGLNMVIVDIPNSEEVADYCQVRVFPTFRFYHRGIHLKEMDFEGADLRRLEEGYYYLCDLIHRG